MSPIKSATDKPLRGVGAKEQRMYEHIKASAQKSGKYGSENCHETSLP